MNDLESNDVYMYVQPSDVYQAALRTSTPKDSSLLQIDATIKLDLAGASLG